MLEMFIFDLKFFFAKPNSPPPDGFRPENPTEAVITWACESEQTEQTEQTCLLTLASVLQKSIY